MNLPTILKIGHLDIDVEEMSPTEALTNAYYGVFESTECRIKVFMGESLYRTLEVLLHEVNHAIYHVYQMEDVLAEETVASVLAAGWTQVYRDNPELLDFIKECIE